ncbi:hypothetical protein [Pseudomonas sp. Z4-20]|uniref:hypothetical protein n=1 Tax=Pseudomonas sp. Z4-20 TaxID=2817414 RepID=UPI003DAA0E94
MIYSWTPLQSGPRTMAVLDRVEVYVNDVRIPEAGFTVQPEQENQEYFLFDLPKGRLRDGVNKLHYTVQRPSENISSPSSKVNVLYHLKAPGDPSADMVLTIPPEVIKTGVGPEEAARGVEFGFTYPYRRNYDHISFSIGLTDELFDVPDLPSPVVKILGTEEFLRAGDNPRAALQFRVTDQLGNSNQSSEEYMDIHVRRVQLPAPIPREILGESDDDPSLIDLEKLGDDLWLIILTSDPHFMPGDTIEAIYVTKVAGQPDVTFSVTGTVETDQFGQKIPCILEIPKDKVIPNSTVEMSYELLRGIELRGTSRTAHATVIGQGGPGEVPVILGVEDGNGIAIVQGATTLYRQVVVYGKAAPSSTVGIYDGFTQVGTAQSDASGAWRGVTVTLEIGGVRNLVARERPGGTDSNTWVLTIVESFNSTSTFEKNYDGWNKGPAASHPDDLLRYQAPGEGWVLHNMTYSQASNGIILFKRLQIRKFMAYEFAIRTRRIVHEQVVPILSLETSTQAELTPATPISSADWVGLAGRLPEISADEEIAFRILSHVATGGGNDYEISHIWVRSVLRPSILVARDPGGNSIPNGDSTSGAFVTLSGFAVPGVPVQVMVNTVALEPVTANLNGEWSVQVPRAEGGFKECRAKPGYWLNEDVSSIGWRINFTN